VKEPLVIRADQENTQPVVSIAVLSPTMNLRDLTSLTDQTIVKGLENVPGVARIDVNGRITRQILVQIKPTALTALGISVDQVAAAIRAANQDVPAGRITRGQSDSIVRVEGKIKDSGAVQAGSSSRCRAARRSTCRRSPTSSTGRRNRLDRPHQRPIVDHARPAEVAGCQHGRHRQGRRRRRRRAEEAAAADVEIKIVNSVADEVEKGVNRVKSTILEGAGLTVLIVFLFLHSWRSTIITA
jgi:multidrug efflux pump subunit AcrB